MLTTLVLAVNVIFQINVKVGTTLQLRYRQENKVFQINDGLKEEIEYAVLSNEQDWVNEDVDNPADWSVLEKTDRESYKIKSEIQLKQEAIL